jgi:CHAT domain
VIDGEVALSACETGFYDINRNADEFIGLPATFMQIGATGVLGSLWQVDDLATALLMARFYDLHLGAGLTPPCRPQGRPKLAAQGDEGRTQCLCQGSRGQGQARCGQVRRTRGDAQLS